MSMLVAGIVVFFGVHLVRAVAPEFRERMIARLGPWGWRGVYSLASLAGLALMVHGYVAAKPHSPWLWSLPVWTRHLAGLVMLPALILLVAAYLPGRIRRVVKHPMMIAVILWSAVHLAANGQAVDVLFFGSFLVWGLVVTMSAFSRSSASSPLSLPATRANDFLAVAAGAAAWAWLAFGGHRILFGIPVFG